MLVIIALVATIIMIIKDYKKFYVYLLMFAGILLYHFWVYGGTYGLDVSYVGWFASLVPVAVLFVAIISRRNNNAE